MSSSDSSFSVLRCQRIVLPPGYVCEKTVCRPVGIIERTLFLGLLLGLLSSSGTTGGSATSGRGGGTTTRADVRQEVLDILALESLYIPNHGQHPCFRLVSDGYRISRWVDPSSDVCCQMTEKPYLGEQRGPDGLDFDTGGLDQGLQLVGLEGTINCQ